MNFNNAPVLVPTKITRYWLENDDFLSEFILLNQWSPFEAACLICNLKPDSIIAGKASVGRVPDPDLGEDYNQDAQDGLDVEGIINLTKIIIRNFDNQPTVAAVDVVKWAVSKELIGPRSYLARRMLNKDITVDHVSSLSEFDSNDPARLFAEVIIRKNEAAEAQIDSLQAEIDRLKKNNKNTGKHHSEKRFKILGAALSELAISGTPGLFIKKCGTLNASKLAEHLHDQRHRYDLQEEAHGFGIDTIKNSIREALKAVNKKSE